MKDVVIVSACRTAIGTLGGTLKNMIGARIAAVVMKEAIGRAGIDPVMIDDVRFGCCVENCNTLNTARVESLGRYSGNSDRCYAESRMHFRDGSRTQRRSHDQSRYGRYYFGRRS